MKIFFLTLAAITVLLFLNPSHSNAQWDWEKGVGISGSTDWSAVSQGSDGKFYFSGVSDKLAGSPSKGFVMGRYNDTLKALTTTKLLGGSTIYRETANGVDALGNSYMMDRVTGGQKLKNPDGSEFSYFLNYYFVAKYLPDGSMAWSKKITVNGYSKFQVMPDGTVGILATTLTNYFYFGDDSIPAAGSTFIEITPDGKVGRAVGAGDAVPSAAFVEWKSPGKVFVVNVSGSTSGPWLYQRGTYDLDAAVFTAEGTPLSVTGSPNTFFWYNNGFPNSPTTVLEPVSGHLFALMNSTGGNSYLNLTDTIYAKVNTQTNDGYLVELDDQMKVVRKIHLTNPQQIAVRDGQVAVTAIVRATGGFGFQTPEMTIKITKTNNNQDGYVVYVMDRQFHYLRHGLVESELQRAFGPNATLIDAAGNIYVSFFQAGGLFFQGQPTTIFSSGTLLAKLGGTPAAVREESPLAQISLYPNPTHNEIAIELPGSFGYQIFDLLGNSLRSGSASERAVCNLSLAAEGTYFVVIDSKGQRISRIIKKD
ncbi:MAG: T9SS type A sorting domain-containing protein [Ignavibacteriota bacterium]